MADRAKPKDDQWKIVDTKMPSVPTGLSNDGLSEWLRIEHYLTALGRVAEVDKQALTVYCTQYGHFARLMREELADTHIELYGDGPTCKVIHPLLPPLLRSGEVVVEIAGQFGMTARTRDLGSDHGNRKATALKRLMGNQRKVARRDLECEVVGLLPDWTEQDMEPPAWMNDVAKAEYRELGDKLRHIDLFTPLDVAPLAIGCSLYELYGRAMDQMTDLYTTVVNRKGEEVAVKEHPLHKAATEIHKLMRYIWKDYGQTPRFRKVFEGETKPDEARAVPIVFKGAG